MFGKTRYIANVHIGWMNCASKDWSIPGCKTLDKAYLKGQRSLDREINRLIRHGNYICLMKDITSSSYKPTPPPPNPPSGLERAS